MQPDTRPDTLVCTERKHTGRACGSRPEPPVRQWVQLSAMQLTFRCHIRPPSAVCYLTKAQQQKGKLNPKLSERVHPKTSLRAGRTLLRGMLTMAGNHDAAAVTRAHWRKPSHVSSSSGWRTPRSLRSLFGGGSIQINTCQQIVFSCVSPVNHLRCLMLRARYRDTWFYGFNTLVYV